jgi:hypothetical protein
MSEESGGSSRFPRIWIIVLVVIGIIIVGDLNRRMNDARRLERDAELLATEYAALATDTARLQTAVAMATSDEVVERWAHGDARLVRDGEVLVVPVSPDDVIPTPIPGETDEKEASHPWEVWLALLFGGSRLDPP